MQARGEKGTVATAMSQPTGLPGDTANGGYEHAEIERIAYGYMMRAGCALRSRQCEPFC